MCYHFEGRGGGIVVGSAFPTLIKKSDEKCMCTKCKSEFPISFMETMGRLTEIYANADCTTVIAAGKELILNSNPVKYYYSGPNEICYVNEHKRCYLI